MRNLLELSNIKMIFIYLLEFIFIFLKNKAVLHFCCCSDSPPMEGWQARYLRLMGWSLLPLSLLLYY
jgi:hypothetical protein